MTAKRVNLEYLRLYYKELFLLLAFALRFRGRDRGGKAILIVNTCLIGEFVVSIPAIRDFIIRHEGARVDLLVAPSQRALAERIIGVRKVYVAHSVHGRDKGSLEEQSVDSYDRTIVLRVSPHAFRMLRRASLGAIRTSLPVLSAYGPHLLWCLALRRAPKQWREMNFKMLGGTWRLFKTDDLFRFSSEERMRIESLPALMTPRKKVLVHATTNWPMKQWGNGKWIELLTRLGGEEFRFIFIGGKEDVHDCSFIASHLPFETHSLAGELDLAELALCMEESDYFIGIDSGPGNLAHVVDLRSLIIYGPGPHMYLPWNSRDVFVDKSRGRGLFQLFLAKETGFIHEVSVDDVFHAFRKLVAQEAVPTLIDLPQKVTH